MIEINIKIKQNKKNENYEEVSAEFHIKGEFATEGEKRVCKEFEKRLKTDEREQILYNIDKDDVKKQLEKLLKSL